MSVRPTLWQTPPEQAHLELPGLEVDNLLAFLALLGLLRALERAEPTWRARAAWSGPPWRASLHLAAHVGATEVAEAAARGVQEIAARFDVDGRLNVDFSAAAFRAFAQRVRTDPPQAALAAALVVEWPRKDQERLYPSALVMMFGQGHQNFLERFMGVSRGELPARLAKSKRPPDLAAPAKIAEALFEPWTRNDDADGFRWDPEDDQRYALRFDDPSRAGAALTVHGANRLATIGLLSFACMPAFDRQRARGVVSRPRQSPVFTWPVWTQPLSRIAIEHLLDDPRLVAGDTVALAPLGVREVYVARRISNGKFVNVTRAMPASRAQ